jgi:hypothetical protein
VRFAGILLVAAVAGCNLEPRPIPCSTWESADAAGHCHWRPFTRPAAGDALGNDGARDVQAVIDSRGHGLLAFGSSAGIELLEEGAPGQWTLRHAGQAVQGGIVSDLVAGPDGTAALAYLRGGVPT